MWGRPKHDDPWSRWPNFTREEMACSCCGRVDMKVWFMDWLQGLRTRLGEPMPANSGYRCEKHPAEARRVLEGRVGAHRLGCAADIGVHGETAYRLTLLASGGRLPEEPRWRPGLTPATGIGLKQHGPRKGRYVHLDRVPEGTTHSQVLLVLGPLLMPPRPRVWTYE